jgi:biotin carboxyl carrier protein
MTYEVTIDGTTRVVQVERLRDGMLQVTLDGVASRIDLQRPSPEALQMLIDGESWECGCVPAGDGYMVDVRGVSVQVDVVDPRRRPLKLGGGAAGGLITTAMPGRVVRVLAAPGDVVRKGQPLLVVEAMKMENEIKSPTDGTLAEVWVAEGQAVETGAKLARVER